MALVRKAVRGIAMSPLMSAFPMTLLLLTASPVTAEDRCRLLDPDRDWNLLAVNACGAWKLLEEKRPREEPGGGIAIGHVDTGYSDHPAIKVDAMDVKDGYNFLFHPCCPYPPGKACGQKDEVPGNPRDPLEGKSLIGFCEPGHGTQTSSMIIGVAPPGEPWGVTGIAPGVALVPLRSLHGVILNARRFHHMAFAIAQAALPGQLAEPSAADCTRRTTEAPQSLEPVRELLAGPDHDCSMVGRQVDVISMSVGGDLVEEPPEGPGATLHNLAIRHLRAALRFAEKQGVIVVAAAGQTSSSWFFRQIVRIIRALTVHSDNRVALPARWPETIAVAGTTRPGKPWNLSFRGRGIDIAAPANNVWAATKFDKPEDRWTSQRGSGTSLSTATTAGVAAMWLQYNGRDALIAAYGRSALTSVFRWVLRHKGYQCDDHWPKKGFGPGRLDAEAVLRSRLPSVREVCTDEKELDDHQREEDRREEPWIRELLGCKDGCESCSNEPIRVAATETPPPGEESATKCLLKSIGRERRLEFLRGATVWLHPDLESWERWLETIDVLSGPKGAENLFADGEVACDFKAPDPDDPPHGNTPKFQCAIGQDEFKVKYGRVRDGGRSSGHENREIFAEIAASRLLWALGFGADRVYLARVVCQDCPKEPWRASKGSLPTERGRLLLDPASIERKFKAQTIRERDRPSQGWSWQELDLVDEKLGGATRTERDALRLLAAFLQHSDNKASQQRLVCRKEDAAINASGTVECRKPVALIQDVGATFGGGGNFTRNSAKMSYRHWAATPVWVARSKPGPCVAKLNADWRGTLQDPVISEAGRAFLARLLVRFAKDHERVRQLFRAAGVDRMDDPEGSVEDWSKTFEDKVRTIDQTRCQ